MLNVLDVILQVVPQHID